MISRVADYFGLTIAIIGLILLHIRLSRHKYSQKIFLTDKILPFVSIVVPARNEEGNLPRLLASLTRIAYPNYEVILVDDQSEDRTFDVASNFPVRVIRGIERPSGWRGKQWAAHQGAQTASGEYLLFTDADTEHYVGGLRKSIEFAIDQDLDVLTALPFHRTEKYWERLLGPFHIFLIAVTAPYAKPRKKQVFAIGQYLMFRKSAYEQIGGHEAVRSEIVEDLPLANLALAKEKKYGVYTTAPIFSVRMYASITEFMKGWTRNFRAGMRMSTKSASLEIAAFIAAVSGGFHFFSPAALVISLLALAIIAFKQKTFGDFSVLGPILFPFAVGLFVVVAIKAVVEELLSRPLVWKNREYS